MPQAFSSLHSPFRPAYSSLGPSRLHIQLVACHCCNDLLIQKNYSISLQHYGFASDPVARPFFCPTAQERVTGSLGKKTKATFARTPGNGVFFSEMMLRETASRSTRLEFSSNTTPGNIILNITITKHFLSNCYFDKMYL